MGEPLRSCGCDRHSFRLGQEVLITRHRQAPYDLPLNRRGKFLVGKRTRIKRLAITVGGAPTYLLEITYAGREVWAAEQILCAVDNRCDEFMAQVSLWSAMFGDAPVSERIMETMHVRELYSTRRGAYDS